MPTSPLPSSSNTSGLSWPKGKPEGYKISNTDKPGSLAFEKCSSGFESDNHDSEFLNSKCTHQNPTTDDFVTKKLTVDIGKTRENALENKHCLEDSEECVSLISDCSTNTAYKVYELEETRVDMETRKSEATYCKTKCENCVRLNSEHFKNANDSTTVNVASLDRLDENKLNRSKVKKHRRNCCYKILLAVIFIILLVAVTSLLTLMLNKPDRGNPNGIGDEPKDEGSIEQVTNEPYMDKLNRLLLSGIFTDRDRHSRKLPGIYMHLDRKSLEDAGNSLKYKPSLREKFGEMENRDIEYSNGLFRVHRNGWYIIYSKLYLVTYKEYDKSGNISMKLYNYQHCLDFDVRSGNKKIDSICNKGSFWGGHKGTNHIWKPVYLKKDVTVKVTMSNKAIVSPDELLSSFEMFELTHD